MCAYILRKTLQTADWCNVARVTIDDFPDLVLLEIFDICLYCAYEREEWHTLVHVCRRWRNIVFGSPHRLDLRLFCTAGTPVRKTLDIWPLLPIDVLGVQLENCQWGADNIIAALEHNDRIHQLTLCTLISSISQWEIVLAPMLQPFPELTSLQLQLIYESAPNLPASFLGGYAPRLQKLELRSISFPELPKLLLSTTHLVSLCLESIPPSGYILPKTMVTSLSLLTRLETLKIGFIFCQNRPDPRSRHPPPLTRTLLPVLTALEFQGVSEYLEDLVTRIDTPLLDTLRITFSHQLIFDTPQVTQFIGRTPKFKAHAGVEAQIAFDDWAVQVELPCWSLSRTLDLGISCRKSDWQLSSLAQVCNSSLPHSLISPVEYLYIRREIPELHWQDDVENSQWLEVLQPFTGVKELHLSQEFVPHIAPVLKELIEEGTTEVLLPALQTLFLEEPLPSGPVQNIIEEFVASRQHANHPIALSIWDSTGYIHRSA